MGETQKAMERAAVARGIRPSRLSGRRLPGEAFDLAQAADTCTDDNDVVIVVHFTH